MRQEFGRDFVNVVWPNKYRKASRTTLEEVCRVQLATDLGGASLCRRKYELTFGLFSFFDSDETMMTALQTLRTLRLVNGW